MSGAEMIAAERQRQIDVEGWTPEHDTEHDHGEMARAAACYITHALRLSVGWGGYHPPDWAPFAGHQQYAWPWESMWWRPSPDPIRNLVKAGALIAAEIDRLRAEQKPTP